MTELPAFVAWALLGWCWPPRPWPWPPRYYETPADIPPPDRENRIPFLSAWALIGIIGAGGGVLGGFIFSELFARDFAADAGLLVTFAGALVGAQLATDILGTLILNRLRGVR